MKISKKQAIIGLSVLVAILGGFLLYKFVYQPYLLGLQEQAYVNGVLDTVRVIKQSINTHGEVSFNVGNETMRLIKG